MKSQAVMTFQDATSEPTPFYLHNSKDTPATMQTVNYHVGKPVSDLVVSKAAVPTRLPGQLLVHVATASLTTLARRQQMDVEIENAWLAGPPRVAYGIAGHVAQCDSESGFRPGDRVMGYVNHVAGELCAEYAICDAHQSMLIPESMPMDEAAVLPLAGTMALRCIREEGKVVAGDRVLINGASGGVGAIAIQIAKRLGAHVTAVARSTNETFCCDLGADEFISYQDMNFTWNGQRWDMIFDVAGTSNLREVLDALKQGGRYVTTNRNASGLVVNCFAWLFSKSGFMSPVQPSVNHLRELILLYEMGHLLLPIGQRFAMEHAKAADRCFEEGLRQGKIVLFNAFDRPIESSGPK